MAGYVDVPHSTYAEWRIHTIGNEYDLEGSAGFQCWDYASLFWRNVGFSAGYPHTGPDHGAYECWTVNREANKGNKFDLIYNLSEVKAGDVVVLDKGHYTGDLYGHIAFADEDYNGTNTLRLVGQNQEHPSAVTGYKVTADDMNVTKFLGAFRYIKWEQTVRTHKKSKFPWVLYAKKLRDKRSGL